MRFIIGLSFLSLAGCQSMTLKPLDSKHLSATYVVPTTLSKQQLYENGVVYLSKNMVNSNYAIRMQDKEAGRIIARMSDVCEEMLRPDVINISSGKVPTTLIYNVDLIFKDKKSKITLEIINVESHTLGGTFERFVPQASGQEQAVRKCLDQLKNKVEKGITEAAPGQSDF